MNKVKWIPILLLRLIAMAASLCATIIMITAHDSAQVLGMTFKAKYTNSPTLKYYVIVNAIAAGYSFVILFLPSKNSLWRLILVSDLVITSFLISSLSATLGVAQLGKEGNLHAGWLPICDQVSKFCDQTTVSIVAGFVAVILYFLLLVYSLNNVLNLFTMKS